MVFWLFVLKVVEVVIGLIGCGYDLVIDVCLKYCKGGFKELCLFDIKDGDDSCDIVLFGGILIFNVLKFIKCDKGECMCFSFDVFFF